MRAGVVIVSVLALLFVVGERQVSPGSVHAGPSARSGAHNGACGSVADFDPKAALCDTIFVYRYSAAKTDSGFDLVQVDHEKDTLSLYLQWITDVNPHLRLWGPTFGITRGTQKRLFRLHRLRLEDQHEIFESSTDLTTQGANSGISDIRLGEIDQSATGLSWQQAWRFVKHTGSRDTISVVRTVRMRCGDPYFLVRYDLTWLGTRPGSERLIWSNHPRMGTGGSRHDVGFAPGYGLITRQRVLPAEGLDYFAAMLDMGNPLAAHVDTVAGGGSSYMSPKLRVDLGSGNPEFLAAFICFNPRQSIVPDQFAWMDSTGEGVPSLDFDSPQISLDTTRVLDSGSRVLLARTPVIEFAQGETKTLEYAVGRARLLNDRLPPILPDVTWPDGTKSRCPKTPAR